MSTVANKKVNRQTNFFLKNMEYTKTDRRMQSAQPVFSSRGLLAILFSRDGDVTNTDGGLKVTAVVGVASLGHVLCLTGSRAEPNIVFVSWEYLKTFLTSLMFAADGC